MAVKIKQCTCSGGPAANFQDSVYGKGQRVHNENTKGAKCTVCGNVKLGGGLTKAK